MSKDLNLDDVECPDVTPEMVVAFMEGAMPQEVFEWCEQNLHDRMQLAMNTYAPTKMGWAEAIKLIECLVQNDPNGDAADAVTVYQVWKNGAEQFLKKYADGGGYNGAKNILR